MTTRHVLSIGSVALAIALAGSVGAQPAKRQAQPPPDPNSGAYLYRAFCASCHGESGRGDGVVADVLRTPPSDLTTISARRRGVFPKEEMTAIVDGRKKVPGHGQADMPVWGDVLLVTEGRDAATVRKRIDALVGYLETIQRPGPQ